MKKVFILVAVFLMGITTQAETNTQAENVTINPGKNHRYTNAQEITFVENGVLYAVSTDGSFSFEFLHPAQNYYRKGDQRRAYYNIGKKYKKGKKYHKKNKRRAQIVTDHHGNIISIGHTQITYQRNGKVRTIGCVPLRYQRGLLVQAGNMEIVYNRRGYIRDTYGFINRENRYLSQNDRYTYNDDRRDSNNNDWSDLERQHDRVRKSL